MYAGNLLVDLLEKQEQKLDRSDFFKKGIFEIFWRAKVGSFLHPDGETIVSAGEPTGAWKPTQSRPEDKRNVSQNLQQLSKLPLHGYLPGSSIRGIVRAWARRQGMTQDIDRLLGTQIGTTITAGCIEFLDAWPTSPTLLTLDIVNPQQDFQVFHQGQGTPLSFYTLGCGDQPVALTVAIRGIPNRATPEDVQQVWEWVEQALVTQGIGSRTASGYGQLQSQSKQVKPKLPDNHVYRKMWFTLYSQGCYGANQQQGCGNEELRPSHWRGWLRSWMLRFFLGVMTPANAHQTLAELMGVLEPDATQGILRTQLRVTQKFSSTKQPEFFTWRGEFTVSGPENLVDNIVMPVIKFAATCGGIGRGWRRPLHVFLDPRSNARSRGSHLVLTKLRTDPATNESKKVRLELPLDSTAWNSSYDNWLSKVREYWSNRVIPFQNPPAEAFSPRSCSVYLLLGPTENPINHRDNDWFKSYQNESLETRGDGMALVYRNQYKKRVDLGGDAANGNSHCSWVSIRRLDRGNSELEVKCQEIVCLFMGGVTSTQQSELRCKFLQDLQNQKNSMHLFGVNLQSSNPNSC